MQLNTALRFEDTLILQII